MPDQHFIVTCGLPGAGKSTVAEGVAEALGAALLSVDPIEAAMWRSGLRKEETGIAAYQVAAAIAAENLKLGLSVIVDAVNPVEQARSMWRGIAARFDLRVHFIECVCTDTDTHRRRIESRVRNIEGMAETDWDRVQERRAEYQPWSSPRLTLDTTNKTPRQLVEKVLGELRQR